MIGKKYGGRTKGTPNVITGDLRAFIYELVSKHLEADLNAIEPRKRAELLIRCLPFVLPTYPNDQPEPTEPLTLVLTRESCSKCDALK